MKMCFIIHLSVLHWNYILMCRNIFKLAFCDEKSASSQHQHILVYFIHFYSKNINILYIFLLVHGIGILHFIYLFYLMCECLPAGTSDMYTMFMSGSCDSEKMLLYSVVMESQMEPHRFWELNQGSLKEQHVLLTSKLSFQPLTHIILL